MSDKNEIMFVHKDIERERMEDLLGPFEKCDGPIVMFDDDVKHYAHIMHRAGIFRSTSEARKNGWDRPLERGYRHFCVGKGKKNIYVLWNLIRIDEVDQTEGDGE